MIVSRPGLLLALALLPCGLTTAAAAERTEHFDKDPDWEGVNNRVAAPRTIRQDFGYSLSAHAGRSKGEVGGWITPAAEPAYYARPIPTRTFADSLSASGTVACTGRQFHVLVGFFNSDTLNEWRTPNTVALRLYGRGDVFYAFVEYASRRWRAGGDNPGGFPTLRDPRTGKARLRGFAAKGAVHTWSLRYDPHDNGGTGAVTATIDGETAVCRLDPGHQADGAAFNRFGLLNVMKHADGGGEIWLDDVTVNGATERFDRDPGWEGRDNRRTYATRDVRPRFDFGYSPTHFSGGRASGELGGLVFRGDCRSRDKVAAYGDRLELLTLAKPLKASGTVSLRRGVSDSTTLLGFYHSADSLTVTPSQAAGIPKNFFGLAIDGPSREGFWLRPVCRADGEGSRLAPGSTPPYLYPDGTAHAWSLDYSPAAGGGRGRISVTLDGRAVHLDLADRQRGKGARFDRFGLVTTWIDGNGQRVYFDDLSYTWKQE
jgi:hypothetical protein